MELGRYFLYILFLSLKVYPVRTLYDEFFNKENILLYREKAKSMFYHAYNGYMNHAFPYDELRPLTCDGHNTWGSYSLSLIDAMDTLVVMGNYTEFQRVVQLVLGNTDFDKDINVSVFETNIRVVGGLLSAHLLSHRGGLELELGWPCQGPLLRLAEEVAKRLLPAFATATGMPYGTVNLRYGVPKGETPVTCTAGVGTFLVEFGTLSRLTGNPLYENTAVRAMDALWQRKSNIGLVGNHINVNTGEWTALDSGIGAGVDSYFEYLLKGGVLLHTDRFLEQLDAYTTRFEEALKKDDWYLWVNMKTGAVTLPVFQSLEAFWPGIQALMGDAEKGRKTILNYFQVFEQFGATPEFYSLTKLTANTGREGYPLRPELVESAMYLYRATGDKHMMYIGASVMEALESIAKTDCGYAVVNNVVTHRLANRMESFFLAETTKYLYLLFDEDNFIHNSGSVGTIIETPNGKCVLDAGGYIFNTEAHPIDIAALDCCHKSPKEQINRFMEDLNLRNIVDITSKWEHRFASSEKVNEYADYTDADDYEKSWVKMNNEKQQRKLRTCIADPFYAKFALYGETVIQE
ncbi:ER degradation-enhancing alpha-mannosidase-like protein 2 [Watersipora subatra]|uniref:ER degradation-enhancing alpha-mannosidase-like protein 2 n=1 Tax=Watersipora subatra TaxID=2589382 RepID=UPI00355AD690